MPAGCGAPGRSPLSSLSSWTLSSAFQDIGHEFRRRRCGARKPGQRSPFHCIRAGRFRKTLSDGRRQILNFLLPGDLVDLQQEFGDASMHGVEAFTDCTLRVPNDGLWTLFREHPRLGYDITWLSAHEESHVDDHLLTAGPAQRHRARGHAASAHPYRRMERIGLVEAARGIPLNQQHIADALGLLVHYQQDAAAPVGPGSARTQERAAAHAQHPALARIAEYYDRPPLAAALL